MKDQISIERLKQCHPKVRDIFSNFIDDCENEFNITLRIMLPVFRTIHEQDELYAQGRTIKGKIVTNSKGGQSFHNYGLAIDICEYNQEGNHEMDWNFDNSKLYPIAKRYNIEWGGNWQSIKDRPHFQISFGYTWQQLILIAKDEDGYPTIS